MEVVRKFVAELLGTFWLVFAGCGSALLAAGFLTPTNVHLGIGFVGVSLAFGLTVVSMAYGIGHISGAHLNPAVTLGLFLGGRVHVKDVVPYFIAQCAGGIGAAFLLFFICSGAPAYDSASYAGVCNGFAAHSPGGYSLVSSFAAEAVLTFVFLMVILGSTDWRAGRFRRSGHRSLLDFDSLVCNSGNELQRQSGKKSWSCPGCDDEWADVADGTVVAVYCSALRRGGAGWFDLPLNIRCSKSCRQIVRMICEREDEFGESEDGIRAYPA